MGAGAAGDFVAAIGVDAPAAFGVATGAGAGLCDAVTGAGAGLFVGGTAAAADERGGAIGVVALAVFGFASGGAVGFPPRVVVATLFAAAGFTAPALRWVYMYAPPPTSSAANATTRIL